MVRRDMPSLLNRIYIAEHIALSKTEGEFRSRVVIAVVMDARYPEALPFATHQFSTKAPPKFDNWVE